MQVEEQSEMVSTASDDVVEVELVSEGMGQAIRQMRSRGMAKKAIARELGLDIKTVRKWLAKQWMPQKRGERAGSLAPYAEMIRKRFPEIGYNAVVMHRELREAGSEGSYVTLQRFVRPLRAAAQPEQATARFETPPARQAQVDWGQTGVWIGEQKITVHLFVMVLGFSRRIFVRAYQNERIGNLLDGHEAAFAHFGGRTETILYDNPRTIVTGKDEATGQVEWNRRFKDRMDFYGVDIRLCRYYRAQTKGKVESGVKYVKRNALVGRRFESFEALNAWLDEWARTIADERMHGTTHERPAERFERDERVKMIPTQTRPPSRECGSMNRRVSSDGFVEVETNRYPVPYQWCRGQAQVQLGASQVRIVCEGQLVVYERVLDKHRVVRWSGPPRELRRGVSPAATPADPPRFDPVWIESFGRVSARPLDAYAAVAEEVGS